MEPMGHGGGVARALAPVLKSAELDCSGSSLLCRSNRDSIRSISVSGGGLCRSALFLPPAAEEGEGSCSSSSASSASSPRYSSSSPDGWAPVHELRAIADRMFRYGYTLGLIRAFGGAAACSSGVPGRPDELLLESWFSELDVDWVLRTGQGGGEDGMVQLQLGDLQDLMERWIRALLTMVQVLCITQLELRAKRPTVAGVKNAIWHFPLLATEGTPEYEEVVQFARFAEASVLRMLAFIDAVAVAALDDRRAPETLPVMLQVHACVSKASPTVLSLFKETSDLLATSWSGGEMQGATSSAFDSMKGVFLRKRKKLSDVIWTMMEKVRASFLTDESWRVPSPEAAAGGVHETTVMMTNYITLLWHNVGVLRFVLQDHHFSVFVSKAEGSSSVVNLIADMVSCLEHQLVDVSQSISDDPGRRCMFLLNNWHFALRRVESLDLPSWTPIDRCKVQRYMDAYLDVSWGPLLYCLYDDVPFGFRRYSSLAKFESGFQRTYAAQKLWKVPDPELRRTLRVAIIDKVVSGYSAYLAERPVRGKNTRQPRSTPGELEELLREIFEG